MSDPAVLLQEVSRLLERARDPWMDSKEAAAYVRMNHSEFKALAACGEIPRHEIRPKRYRYYAPELTEWLLER